MKSSCRWSDLDDKAQEHVVSFLGPSGSLSMRSASSTSRELVNRGVSSVHITRTLAGPISDLQPTTRFTNLQKLKLSDTKLQTDQTSRFTRGELIQLFKSAESWSKLTELDIALCHDADILCLCVILKAVQNLQSLNTRLPYCLKAPAAAARAIAQLSNLRLLNLTTDMGDRFAVLPGQDTLIADELQPLTALGLLDSLSLRSMEWKAMNVVEQLASLTALTLLSPTSEHSDELQRLTKLTKLIQLEFTTYHGIDCDALGAVLASIPTLRSFHSEGLASAVDTPVCESILAVAAATQLTRIKLGLWESEDADMSVALAECLHMPNLAELLLEDLNTVYYGGYSSLLEAAACASTMKVLSLSISNAELAALILDSVAFRSLKLEKVNLGFYFDLFDEQELPQFPTALMQALCSQTALRHLELSVYSDECSPLVWPENAWAQIAKQCPHLSHIDLSGSNFPTTGLGSLPNLQYLMMRRVDVEDSEMVHLFACQSLRYLEICCCDKLTPEAFAALIIMLPELRELQIYGCKKVKDTQGLKLRSDLEVSVWE